VSDLARDIGRCLMVGVRGAHADDPALRADLEACRAARCKAVILFDRDLPTGGARNVESPVQVAELVRFVKERLGEGTLVAVDQEGGRVARLRPERGFEEHISAAEFAALPAEERGAWAERQAAQCARLGIDVNFAPVVDLDLCADERSVLSGGRAYGADAETVTACAHVVIEAQRRAGVVSCLKHFPGHGSCAVDSHFALPEITETFDGERELAPYRALLREGDASVGVMTAHVLHRGYDAELPASLSPSITGGLLRDRLGFDGLVVTDSLDMRAVADRFPAGEAAALALIGGADLALDGNNHPGEPRPCPAPEMAEGIARAVRTGRLSENRVRESAERVERSVRWAIEARRGA